MVLGREKRMEKEEIEKKEIVKSSLIGEVERLIGNIEREEREGWDELGWFKWILKKRIRWEKEGKKEEKIRLGWINNEESKENINRIGIEEIESKEMREENERNGEKSDLRMEEFRIDERDDEIENNGELEEEEKRIERKRRDNRIEDKIKIMKVGENVMKIGIEEIDRMNLIDVGKGGERILREGKKKGEEIEIRVEGGKRIGKIIKKGEIERVERMRKVEKDEKKDVKSIKDDCLIGNVKKLIINKRVKERIIRDNVKERMKRIKIKWRKLERNKEFGKG